MVLREQNNFLLAFLCCLCCCSYLKVLCTDLNKVFDGDTLTLGRTAVMSGPTGIYGALTEEGFQAALHQANTRRELPYNISLKTLDDGYEPEPAVQNIESLLADEDVFAIAFAVGTPIAQAILPFLIDSEIPTVGFYTGARFLNEPFKANILNVRASYDDECKAMVNYAHRNLGLNRFSIFYQNDPFGESGLQGTREALFSFGLELVGSGSYERNTIEVEGALGGILEGDPQVVILFGTGQPNALFAQLIKQTNPDIVLMTGSFSSEPMISAMISLDVTLENMFITATVPHPADDTISLVKEYHAALQDLPYPAEPNYLSMEAYLTARLIIESLKSVRRSLTRRKFLDTIYTKSIFYLNEIRVGPFYPNCRNGQISNCNCNKGMHTVWMTVPTPDGNMEPFDEGNYHFLTCGTSVRFGHYGKGSFHTDLVRSGISAAFAEVNEFGGIGGRGLELLLANSEHDDPDILVENGIVAFLSIDKEETKDIETQSLSSSLPIIGAKSMSLDDRANFRPETVYLKSSYYDEFFVLLSTLKQRSIRNIGLFYSIEFSHVVSDLELVFKHEDITSVELQEPIRFNPSTDPLSLSVAQLQKLELEAVIVLTNYETFLSFLDLYAISRPRTYIATGSYLDLSSIIANVTSDVLRFISIASIPRTELITPTILAAQAFTSVYRYYFPSTLLSWTSWESYLDARFAIRSLNLVEGSVNSASLLDSIYNTAGFDLGGIRTGVLERCGGEMCEPCNQAARSIWIEEFGEGLVASSIYHYATCGIPLPQPPSRLVLVLVISITPPLLLIFVCTSLGIFCWLRRRKQRKIRSLFYDSDIRISKEDLEFTDKSYYSQETELWKGKLSDTEVAIRKILVNDLELADFIELCSVVKKLSSLRHPNVVSILGLSDTPYCIVSEYMSLGSLRQVLNDRGQSMPMWLIKNIAKDTCKGMTYLHSLNPLMVHGNLTPQALLLDQKWNTKVSGLEVKLVKKIVHKQNQPQPKKGFEMETLEEKQKEHLSFLNTRNCYFMGHKPPEVMLNKNVPDKSSDVYAFGFILWELIERKSPFEHMDEYELLKMIEQDWRPPINPETDTALSQLIQDCWNTNPILRPSFSEITSRLHDVEISEDDLSLSKSLSEGEFSGILSNSASNLEKMSLAPKDTVTIVFTDVENSTQLWEWDSWVMLESIRLHNSIMRKCIRKCNGYEVKTEGDSFMVAFSSAIDAVNYCANAQLALLKANWPEKLLSHASAGQEKNSSGAFVWNGLRVRMGMHTGEPLVEVNPKQNKVEYLGPEVNLASLISDSANGGHTFISQRTFLSLQNDNDGSLEETIYFECKGERTFAENPQVIYEVHLRGLEKRSL